MIGNTVNGVPQVGQVQLYEFFEGLASGFIESMNYADGSMKIQNGPTLRIADRNAVFSVGYDAAPFMNADDSSPSISSFSGFPMCIPRSETDPLCPLTNRPFAGPGTLLVYLVSRLPRRADALMFAWLLALRLTHSQWHPSRLGISSPSVDSDVAARSSRSVSSRKMFKSILWVTLSTSEWSSVFLALIIQVQMRRLRSLG